MNGLSPTPNSGIAGAASLSSPVKNTKRFSVTKLNSGFLCEMQNVDNYNQTADVAIDMGTALKIAETYFAD